MRIINSITCLLIIIVIVSCSTTQSRHVPLVEGLSPKSEDYSVQVYRDKLPDRPFERISRIDVHLEKTHFISSDFNNALPRLQKEARLSGADAMIEIKESKSSVGETKIYHVTATGIRFLE